MSTRSLAAAILILAACASPKEEIRSFETAFSGPSTLFLMVDVDTQVAPDGAELMVSVDGEPAVEGRFVPDPEAHCPGLRGPFEAGLEDGQHLVEVWSGDVNAGADAAPLGEQTVLVDGETWLLATYRIDGDGGSVEFDVGSDPIACA